MFEILAYLLADEKIRKNSSDNELKEKIDSFKDEINDVNFSDQPNNKARVNERWSKIFALQKELTNG